MNQAQLLSWLLILLFVGLGLSGCDDRLPRPGEPTVPHKTDFSATRVRLAALLAPRAR